MAGLAHLPGALDARNGKLVRIDQPELNQNRRLIPINVLMRQFAVPKSHNYDQGDLHPPASRGIPGSIQSISRLWVNLIAISSTSCSFPIVREIGTISISGGIFGMKCVA
jgi:hypothetical protein